MSFSLEDTWQWIESSLLCAFKMSLVVFFFGTNVLKYPLSIWQMQYFLSWDKKWDERMLKWVFNEQRETPRSLSARASSHERVKDQPAHITWIMTGASSHPHLREPRLRDLMQTSLMQTLLMRVTGHWPHRVQLMSVWEHSREREWEGSSGLISPVCFSVRCCVCCVVVWVCNNVAYVTHK